jgi:hypothetical protein
LKTIILLFMAVGKQNYNKELVRKLNKLSYDFRAEAVVSDLVSNGYKDGIVIDFDSSHKKNWDKDILKAESSGKKLNLTVSRDGILHSLPEYLFMKPVEGSEEATDEILKFNKKQAENTRILFNPIENEIFDRGVLLETFENSLIASLNSGDNESIREFWRIDKRLDKLDQIKLCKIIPHLHEIVGNFLISAKCLEYFLGINVSWKVEESTISDVPIDDNKDTAGGLGTYSCGNNMITGGIPEDTISKIIFTLGPIPDENIEQYLESGKKKELIKTFISYFIPLQYEAEIKLDISNEDAGFTLANSYLGLNSISKA